MKHSILFVDDEPNILQGLKRLLRPMHDQWDMLFAGSGQEALDLLAKQEVHAIVSDMRMPGMDGSELLRQVFLKYPEVIRFALSGYSSHEKDSRLTAPTHQFLMKPCDGKILVEALERALAARSFVPNTTILKKLMSLENLPVLPMVYSQITTELNQGDPSPKRIGEIVAKDVGLSANILKLVNSSFFGLRQHVATPQQAVIILGTSVIRSAIISLHIFQTFERMHCGQFSFQMLWNHCIRASAIGRAIAVAEGMGRGEADDACTATLLHDVGKLLLCATCGEECAQVLEEVRRSNRRVSDVEREQLGMTHAEIGAYLLGLWGLPEAVVQAIANHHSQSPQSQGRSIEDVVYFANVIDHRMFVFNEQYAKPTLDPTRLQNIGGMGKLAQWEQAVMGLNLGQEGDASRMGG